MIKVDLSGAAPFFDAAGPDYAAAAAAHRLLEEKSGPGAEFTGWLELPERVLKGELKQLQSCAAKIRQNSDFETFFAQAPAIHPNAALIKGVVCGVRVEDVQDPLMQKIRYMDKLVDELARGKKMASILRTPK